MNSGGFFQHLLLLWYDIVLMNASPLRRTVCISCQRSGKCSADAKPQVCWPKWHPGHKWYAPQRQSRVIKATVSLFQYFSLYTNLYTHIFDSLIPRCDIFKIRGNILMSRTVGSDYSSYTMYICLYGDEATWDFEMCGFVRNPGYNFQVATLRLHNLSADTEGSSGSWLRTEYHQQANIFESDPEKKPSLHVIENWNPWRTMW